MFDDGDERTLKRTSLCLKGEKHFNESEVSIPKIFICISSYRIDTIILFLC